MNTQNKLKNILNKTSKAPNLESSLIGAGTISYVWYRFRYFILSSFLFYIVFFIKMLFLGEEYTNFYTAKILVFEQFVFWFAQIFWYLIILMQKEKKSLQRLKYQLDIKISIAYSALVSIGIGYFLYQQGLLVFERLTIYGAVSFVFLIQIFITIYLKYLHSHVYAHKRVFINMPLVIASHFALLIMQISLWNKYLFWSIPIVFGLQVIIYAGIKLYYYKLEYDNKLIDESEVVGAKEFIKILFSKHLSISIFMLFPEIFYFILLHLNYINKIDYSALIFLLSALMNSRLPGLLLQDFIKYDSDKYNLLTVQHMKKLILPLFATVFILFMQSSLINYFLNGKFDKKIIFFSFLVSCILTLSNFISNYFFSKKNHLFIITTALTTCFFIGLLVNLFVNNYLFYGFIFALIYIAIAVTIIFNLHKFSDLFLSNIVYLKKDFISLAKKQNYGCIYEIQLDQLNYYHPKIAKILDHYVKNNEPILIISARKIFLARPKNEINPKLLFYCKNISTHTNVESIHAPDQDYDIPSEIKKIGLLNNYNLKVLFSGLFKGHSNYKKRLIR
jgi:hypothetical protein